MKCFTVNNDKTFSGIEINEILSNYYISIGHGDRSINIPVIYYEGNYIIKECSIGITYNDHRIVIMPEVINHDYTDNRALILFQYYENIDIGFTDCHIIGKTNYKLHNHNFLIIMNIYSSIVRILYNKNNKETYYTYDGNIINTSSNYIMKSFSPLKFQEDFMIGKDMIKYI